MKVAGALHLPRPGSPGDTPERHLERLVRAHRDALVTKYRRGLAEHGGVLSRKPGLVDHAFEEAIDLVVYLQTELERRERLGALLADALATRDWQLVEAAQRLFTTGNEEGA